MARPATPTIFLKSSVEIQRVKTTGQRVQTPLFHLALSLAVGSGPTRFGIIVGKRFGRAVARNRVKRRFRELARQMQHALAGGRHVLVFPRRGAMTAPYPQLRESWARALHQHGLLD